MEELTSFEHVVKPPKGFYEIRKKKRNLIILYVAYCAVWAVILLISGIGLVTVPIVVVAASTCFALVKFTWRKTKPEFEYSVIGGVFTLSEIFGGLSRRTIAEVELSDALLIAPNAGMYIDKLNDFAPEKEFYGVFEPDAENVYFMLFEDGDEKCVLYFEAEKTALKLIRRSNGRTVISN